MIDVDCLFPQSQIQEPEYNNPNIMLLSLQIIAKSLRKQIPSVWNQNFVSIIFVLKPLEN